MRANRDPRKSPVRRRWPRPQQGFAGCHPGGVLISRRRFSAAAAGAMGLPAALASLEQAPGRPCAMGIVSYALGIRISMSAAGGAAPLTDPIAFLEECRRLGAGGMQMALGQRDSEYCARLRAMAERHGLHVEGNMDLTSPATGADAIEAQVRTAAACGAAIVRVVVIPGRRYEQFRSAGQFARAAAHALAVLRLAEPLARKHGVRLAVENHKDQRVPERLELLRKIDSEHVGVCLDVGNSFALCEDPMQVVAAYAPWTLTVHLKDQAVRPHDDGFLYADAALGAGFLDLRGMMLLIRKARPEARFNLETITRDALMVPVLTPEYWASMGDVPAAELVRTLRTVRQHSAAEEFAKISALPPAQRLERETRNVLDSIRCAREHLGL